MGKHSDPDPRWFWLSLGAAAGKAVAALLVVGLVVVGVNRWLDGGGEQEQEQAAAPVAITPETPQPAADETATATASPEPATDDDDGFADAPATEDDDAAGQAGDGTVQVLNGSGDPDALDQAIDALEELGYRVVASSRAARGYERTTVFWSDGYDDEARALRAADDRFGVLQPNTRLAQSVNLHVVLGRDWVPEDSSRQ